jgi:hypothetical protein
MSKLWVCATYCCFHWAKYTYYWAVYGIFCLFSAQYFSPNREKLRFHNYVTFMMIFSVFALLIQNQLGIQYGK